MTGIPIGSRRNTVGSRQLAVGNGRYVVFACCLLSIAYFLLTMQEGQCQSTIDFKTQVIGLGEDQDNVIQNSTHLDEFFESLYQLKSSADRKISIVHIGDSHVQGDYLTQPVRRNFQKHFGNAGRGLIVPGKVAGTNESYNIVTASNVSWQAKRCVNPEQPLPVGIGGITIHTTVPGSLLHVYMNDLWMDYSFNKVTLFFQKDVSSFYFSIKDTARHELVYLGPLAKDTSENYSQALLPKDVGAITIETVKGLPAQKQATIFGVSLENGENGVLYHSIGVNGAKYKHYNAAELFPQQTQSLIPELVIISLGTNEALDYPYLDKNFSQHVDKLITSLYKNNPQAKFILVTPPAALLKTGKANPGVVKIREQIIQYAAENGFAFWDMYKAMGGENALVSWTECAWLRPDGIHYTKDAYEHQGNLLFYAIIKSYNQYVSVRHR